MVSKYSYAQGEPILRKTRFEIEQIEPKKLQLIDNEAPMKNNQSKTYKGLIINGLVKINNTNEVLAGVNISFKNDINSVITDIYGNFDIEKPAGLNEYILIFQGVGLKTQYLNITNYSSNKIEVFMEEDVMVLGSPEPSFIRKVWWIIKSPFIRK